MGVPARKAGERLTHGLFRFSGVLLETEGELKITNAAKILKLVSRFPCLTRLGSKGQLHQNQTFHTFEHVAFKNNKGYASCSQAKTQQ